MKKILLLISIALMSCETKNISEIKSDFVYQGRSINIITMDSCEYISYYLGGNSGVLTHKGNCKYCAIRFNEAMKSVAEDIKNK